MYTVHFFLKSFHLGCLSETEKILLPVFSFLGASDLRYQNNPKKCKKITVLRSPHIDKKSREQFQRVTHKKKLTVFFKKKENLFLVFELVKQTQTHGVEIEMVTEFSTS
jgi:small subunit ribosomal protein S10